MWRARFVSLMRTFQRVDLVKRLSYLMDQRCSGDSLCSVMTLEIGGKDWPKDGSPVVKTASTPLTT
ncbi:hypothetical protein D3C84_748410 [compost metagenome]